MNFLFILLAINSYGSEITCGNAEISYKLQNKVTTIEVEACTNKYGQFFSKTCEDGCEFKTTLATYSIPTQNTNYGTPGGNICSKLGYTSYVGKIKLNSKVTENIDFCFGSNNKSFVSTGFLSDLSRKVKK